MPPRYAYWTIIVDDQPTAFRAGALDDIMPTFNRLKEKQPTAKLMWFQSGKLWPSRIDAREAMQVRGERGRYSDPKQDGGDKISRERPKWKSKDFSNPKPPAARAERTEPFDSARPKSGVAQDRRPEWKPRSSNPKPEAPNREQSTKPEWKPKAPGAKPEWKPKGASTDRPAWKPKGAGDRPEWKAREDDSRAPAKPEWKSKSASGDRPTWQSKSAPGGRPFMGRQGKDQQRPEWKPRGSSSPQAPKPSSAEDPVRRKWIPKAEYKKLTGTEAKRDDKWRPGGEHQDPRQKYKDAKKAKWGRFKQAIRSRVKKKS
jgi:hypothetical protein